MSDVFVATVSGQNILHRVSGSDSTVYLREMQEHGIGCIAVVKSTTVRPSLQVTVDSADWTHLFVASETIHSLNRVDNSVTTPVDAVFRLLYVTMKPERRFNGRILECSANTDGYPPVSASVEVVVEC